MKRITMCLAVVGLLVWAAPAMAWTYNDCVEVDFNHPDCEKYEKPPVVPPVVPPVTPPVAPPVTPPAPPVAPPPEVAPPEVAPPVVPPVAPEAPKVERPKRKTVPNAPERDEGTQGKTEQRESGYVPPAPQTETVTASDASTLPYTGLPAGIVALAGAALSAGGYAMRRRAR